MTSRERIATIIAGQPADRCGFWLGNPHPDTWPILLAHFGCDSPEQLRRSLGDDLRWIMVDGYRDGDRREMLPIRRSTHGQAGPLAECRDVDDLDRYPWPDPDCVDYDAALAALRAAGDHYRAGGLWSGFFTDVMALFGFERFLLNMYDNPALVAAALDRLCGFYCEANARFFERAGDELDGFFFGNDFGTQLDLICTPEQFDRFVMPWFRRMTDLAHDWGRQVILHSCGAIARVIDRLIEAGVDCLHPLQARAAGMDAERLARDFGGRIAFMGGIDTQDLLVNAAPAQVKEDVRRVKALLGPRLIVSPSHECILPNVPPANVRALSEGALEA